MTGTITVGLDGADHSLTAADWAAAEAARRDMSLRLVHTPPDEAGAEEAGRRLLSDVAARVTAAAPGVAVGTELLAGDTVEALVAEAAKAGMLVLGARGHGALVGYLLGSVSLHVLRQARGPVVVVRGREPGAPERPGPEEVVVGVQETDEAGAPVLEFAFRAAAARGAVLRAVRTWALPTPYALATGELGASDQAGGLEAWHKQLLGDALRPFRERFPQVTVVEQVELGSAAEVLLTSSGRAGLVVVGRRMREGGLWRIGAAAHAVLHHSGAPVAVVPHA
ncbi:universal stress protein [Streptomyces pactum]|uniref:Universal stress protein n=1 Tax=Streptomyces pactum TaxID=68249 RepID=A0ABS0NE27_9ACTN|nr:universal stress protein [Streptomyces pactum]MBH5333450.1 universal stress protein [Streptomyces pactum]